MKLINYIPFALTVYTIKIRLGLPLSISNSTWLLFALVVLYLNAYCVARRASKVTK